MNLAPGISRLSPNRRRLALWVVLGALVLAPAIHAQRPPGPGGRRGLLAPPMPHEGQPPLDAPDRDEPPPWRDQGPAPHRVLRMMLRIQEANHRLLAEADEIVELEEKQRRLQEKEDAPENAAATAQTRLDLRRQLLEVEQQEFVERTRHELGRALELITERTSQLPADDPRQLLAARARDHLAGLEVAAVDFPTLSARLLQFPFHHEEDPANRERIARLEQEISALEARLERLRAEVHRLRGEATEPPPDQEQPRERPERRQRP